MGQIGKERPSRASNTTGVLRENHQGSSGGLARATPATVRVIVVTHESAGEVGACLSSVFDAPDVTSREVVVVDNASSDGTAALVESRFPEAMLIRKEQRHGFSYNVNLGAAGAESRYLLLLNPDAVLRPGALDRLVAHLASAADVGIVGPRLLYPDGSPQWSARAFPSPLSTIVRRTPLRRWFPSIADSHLLRDLPDVAVDVDWMLGAALLIRRDVFEQLGGMDDRFRLYCEDADLCWRTQAAGWRVQHLGSAEFEHALGQLTRKRFFTRLTVWHLRSIVSFLAIHGFGRPQPAAVPLVVPMEEPALVPAPTAAA